MLSTSQGVEEADLALGRGSPVVHLGRVRLREERVGPRPPRWEEVAGCALGLGLLGLLVFGRHVANGGFYNDDWYLAATYRFAAEPGFLGAVDALGWMAFRPLAIVYFAATHAVFGTDPSLHLALAQALAVAVSTALYSLLRILGLPVAHAAAVAALVLIFPAADSTRLWAAASVVQLGILLCLLGVIVAVRGLREAGGRRAVACHAAALALYVLAVLAYEITAPAIACAAILYAGRAPRRAVLLRWLADVLAVGGTLAAVTLVADSAARLAGPRQQLRQASAIAEEAGVLLARAAVPFGRPDVLVVAAMAAVAAGVAWSVRRAPAADPRRREVTRWLRTAAAGALVVVVGYVPFVPARFGVYRPLVPGQGNRVNALAAVGFVLLVHGVAAAALGAVAAGRGPRWRAWTTGGSLLIAVVLGIGYGSQVQRHIRDWDAASALQRQILADVATAVPDPAPGSVIVVFGHRLTTARGVTTFATPWDLDGAVQLAWDDPTLDAYPLLVGANVGCGPAGLTAPGMAVGPPGSLSKPAPANGGGAGAAGVTGAVAPYGRAVVVDLRTGRALPVRAPADCLDARERIAAWGEAARRPRR